MVVVFAAAVDWSVILLIEVVEVTFEVLTAAAELVSAVVITAAAHQ